MIGILSHKEYITVFGLISKFLDRTSNNISSKDGIDLLLCGFRSHVFVIVTIGNYIIIIVNSKSVSICISNIKLCENQSLLRY